MIGARSLPQAVVLSLPQTPRSAVVFASPHSGRDYPADMLQRTVLPRALLRSSEDAYVDLLLHDAPEHGAPLLTTQVPRAYVDFNRAADELDAAVIEGAPRSALNPRVAAGLGVIARVVANGRAIYRGKLTAAESQARLDQCWHPYHQALGDLLDVQRDRFGQVLLCDVHSMPHDALNGHVARGGKRPDVVVGDRWGASAHPDLTEAVVAILSAQGLQVARNTPFAGAYIAQRYGNPSRGQHVIQIELDRGLYLDERRVVPAAGFDAFQALMRRVVRDIAALDVAGAGAVDLAAE